MKKSTNSIVVALAVSSFAFAGGDIAPVEPMVAEATDSFYIGAGTTCLVDKFSSLDSSYLANETFKKAGFMLQAGYEFNKYLAAEGRYWGTGSKSFYMSDIDYDMNAKISAYGIFAKPMYPITDKFTIYGLLGYGHTKVSGQTWGEGYYYPYSQTKSGLQGGAGVSYALADNFLVFTDYVKLNNTIGVDSGDYLFSNKPYTINFGVTYKF